MADTVQPGAAQDGPQQRGGEVDQSPEPTTGGLTAVLGKLRDAAAAHDDELADPDGLAEHG